MSHRADAEPDALARYRVDLGNDPRFVMSWQTPSALLPKPTHTESAVHVPKPLERSLIGG